MEKLLFTDAPAAAVRSSVTSRR